MPLKSHKPDMSLGALLLLSTAVWGLIPRDALAQYTAAPVTVAEPVAVQMIQGWLKSLAKNDPAGVSLYYADPLMADPWRQRMAVAPIRSANLVAVQGIRPAPEKSWGGVPYSGEVRFTVEFTIEGYDKIIRETRVWGLTNKNGYLQIANEVKEEAPQGGMPPAQASAFPRFGSDPTPTPIHVANIGFPSAAPTPPPQPSRTTPGATPSLNEGPIEKAVLIKELWDQLLARFKKAYEMRSEQLYLKCFAAQPKQALQEFRDRMRQYGWLQILDLAIDEDSVRGNQMTAQFRFRYSLWGPGLKKGQIIEVDASATKGGQGWSPGWRFSRFGEEVIFAPRRPPGYYPTQDMLQSAITPGVPGQPTQQGSGLQRWFGSFGRR